MLYLSVATSKIKSAFMILTMALPLLFLSGCGKKGPLYLPEKPSEEAKVAPETEQPPSQEKAQEQP